MTLRQVATLVKKKTCKSIVVATRNIASRFNSAYINKYLTKYGKPIDTHKFSFPKTLAMDAAQYDYDGIVKPTFRDGCPDICLAQLFMYISDHRVELKNVNAHFTPQVINENELKLLADTLYEAETYQLRVEHFSQDLQFINTSLETCGYIPPRSNESTLPPNWSKCDDLQCAFKQSSELKRLGIIPSPKVTSQIMESNKSRYLNTWKSDIELHALLAKISLNKQNSGD